MSSASKHQAKDVEHVLLALIDTIEALTQALPAARTSEPLRQRAEQATEMAQATIAIILQAGSDDEKNIK
jgi:hypothetical protein